LGRRHKPSHRAVNWTIVVVAGLLTLTIGITVALLTNHNSPGRIVVPQPTSAVAPTATLRGAVEPAAGAPTR
jgi:hypothetical protein